MKKLLTLYTNIHCVNVLHTCDGKCSVYYEREREVYYEITSADSFPSVAVVQVVPLLFIKQVSTLLQLDMDLLHQYSIVLCLPSLSVAYYIDSMSIIRLLLRCISKCGMNIGIRH